MRFGRVLVEGPSMLPVLRPGDCLVVDRRRPVRAGDVVVGRFRERPDMLVVKRAVARAPGGGWLLESDNQQVRGQGLTGGLADVESVVRWRYLPWPPTRVR